MTYKIVTIVATAGLVAGPALAQDVVVSEQGPNELRGDWIIGSDVNSTQGEDIGAIKDLIISGEEGEITSAIVSVGGFLGFGAKQIAVEWSDLNIAQDGNRISLDLTRQEAEEADEYVYRERQQAEAEAATGTDTGSDTDSMSDTQTDTGGDSGTMSETQPESDADSMSDTQTDTGADSDTMSETQPESDADSMSDTQSETPTESESETE